jgi:hypothetical protein
MRLANPCAAIVSWGRRTDLHNRYACRIAIALEQLGIPVSSLELSAIPTREFDLCILSGLAGALGHEGRSANRSLHALRSHSRVLLSLSLASTGSNSFTSNLAASVHIKADAILDVGLFPQDLRSFPGRKIEYLHLFDGLLPDERCELENSPERRGQPRVIPWAHIGSKTRDRVRLTDLLVTEFDPSGLVYLPDLPKGCWDCELPWPESHLEQVLRKAKYFLRMADPGTFHIDSFGYRLSLLAGCIPLTVVGDRLPLPAGFPFRDTVVRLSQLIPTLRSSGFDDRFEDFQSQYFRYPRLEEHLSRILGELGLQVGHGSSDLCVSRVGSTASDLGATCHLQIGK